MSTLHSFALVLALVGVDGWGRVSLLEQRTCVGTRPSSLALVVRQPQHPVGLA